MQKLLLALGLILPLVSQADPATSCSGDLATTGGDKASLSCSGDLPLQHSAASSDAIEVNGAIGIFRDTSSDAARAHGVFIRQDDAAPLNHSILLGAWDIRDDSINKTPLLVLDRSLNIPTIADATNPAAVTSGGNLFVGSGSGIKVQLPDQIPTLEGTLIVGASDSLHLLPAGKPVMGGTSSYDAGWAVISLVPEPSTYATLLLGLAALGWVSRKRG